MNYVMNVIICGCSTLILGAKIFFKNVTFECFFTAPEKNYFVSAGISITCQFAERVNIESWCRQLLCIIVRGLMLNKNLFSVLFFRSKDCKLLIKHL